MRKILALASMVILLFVMSCVNDNEANFQGEIIEMKEESILVANSEVDPEASYPTYDILVDNKTEISGEVAIFSELKSGQKVKIWVVDVGPNNQIDNKVADKIIVQ
ncbi:hypothetical protein [Virgibacillus sp. DJP39]|uniref:hypothetical protein n=1 Tax=Virgibacillus sp. DJP39 TaxID=3409790 RepID=UPI003BB79156